MSEPFADLVRLLSAVGRAHPLAVGLPAALGVLWTLYAWADDTAAPLSRRIAGAATVLLGLALLLRMGVALGGPRPLVPWWQAVIGLVVLPLFVRHGRLGGVAAMLWFVCLALALAAGAAAFVDVPAAIGGALALGAAGALATALARRFAPPPPVEPVALHRRLDTDDAREAADKYTRE